MSTYNRIVDDTSFIWGAYQNDLKNNVYENETGRTP